MRYRVRLAIRYDFGRPTGGGRQLLRIAPLELEGVQRVHACQLEIAPTPSETGSFTDFFGNLVNEVVLPPGASTMRAEIWAEVERLAPARPAVAPLRLAGLAAALDEVTDLGGQSPHHFLPPSPRIPRVVAIGAFAANATRRTKDVAEAVEVLGLALHRALTFDATATHVDTSVAEAFELRRGVCQDFSHIMIAGLRSLGIPSAYVAGFLRTTPPPGRPRLTGADAMHAWVRAWTGPQEGWVEYDPTNACKVALDHVVVGYGRDYGDVAPVTGTLRLDGEQKSAHMVDIEELAPPPGMVPNLP